MRSITFIFLAFSIFTYSSLLGQLAPVPSGFVQGQVHFEEDFESGVPTGWTNLSLDQAPLNNGWVIDRDMTQTPNTGPNGAQSGEFYAYCDGSSPTPRDATAIMRSALIDLGSATSPAVIFYLNMHGQAGSFSANIVDGGNTVEVLPSISADVPNGLHTASQWEEMFISLSGYEGKSVQIEFVTIKPSSGSNGDISIDNVRVVSAATTTTVPTLGQWGIVTLLLSLLITTITTMKSRSPDSLLYN